VPRRRHYPLNAIRPGQQDWAEVVNSPLSEAATLGFEYGFSLGSQVHSCRSCVGSGIWTVFDLRLNQKQSA
jgi:2-oxoglutarate dehydrogenase complex dehydrogenase (E1) component-like enzyme